MRLPGIQDWVYAVEAGSLRVWIIRGALGVLVAGVGMYYAVTQFNGLNSAEAMDLAQVARQVVEGKGFSTKFIRPVIVKEQADLLRAVKKEPMPELVRPPAYPTLLAALFTVTSPEFNVSTDAFKGGLKTYRPEVHILILNVLLLLLSGVVFYLWVTRAFDARVATLATLLFLGTDLLWGFAISGLPVLFMVFLVCVVGYCVNEALLADETVDGEPMSVVWMSIAAVAVGALMLTRYSMLALWLPFMALGYLAFTRRLWCGLAAALIPLAVCLPWFIRNVMVSGNPFGYAWVQLFAADSTLWRLYGGNLGDYVGFRALTRGLLHGLSNCVVNFNVFFGGLLVPAMFLLGFFHMFKRGQVQIARWFWGGALVLLLVFNAVTVKTQNIHESTDLNSLFVLFPALIAFGTAFMFVLVERLPLPSHVLQIPIFALVALLQIYPLGLRLLQHRPLPIAYPPYYPPIMQVLYKQLLESNELQACDMPWAGAWYCDRLSLWLPRNRADFDELNEVYPISALLLTPVSMNKDVRNGEYAEWGALIGQVNTTMHLSGHMGRQERSAYQKTIADSLTQALSEEQPLPYLFQYPVVGTDYYYYFYKKTQTREVLQKMQRPR
ncbi:MAG: hypothetical protein LBK60_10920 [Verrucomicrobiales bacterium]|jgi:hypothetical protein|nr:hypothetical protein [Verrucomicrobiales bacterium]